MKFHCISDAAMETTETSEILEISLLAVKKVI